MSRIVTDCSQHRNYSIISESVAVMGRACWYDDCLQAVCPEFDPGQRKTSLLLTPTNPILGTVGFFKW
jgi:hypothetical protein